MLGTLVTLIAYRKQPTATFVMKHPIRTVRLMRLRRDLRDTFTRRRIAMGLAAAALTIPFGVWLGHRLGEG